MLICKAGVSGVTHIRLLVWVLLTDNSQVFFKYNKLPIIL